jgi:hypothetical protein
MTPDIKNPVFIQNITETSSGKFVKKIFQCDFTKLNKPIERMVWEYYRHRAKLAVDTVIKQYKGYQIKIIYFDDPVIHQFDNGYIERIAREEQQKIDAENLKKKKEEEFQQYLNSLSEEERNNLLQRIKLDREIELKQQEDAKKAHQEKLLKNKQKRKETKGKHKGLLNRNKDKYNNKKKIEV